MSDIYALKSTFNGGELSPMLDARVDSEKYAAGCKELTNFLPTVYGGIKKRPGTELVGFTKDNGPARLHSFKRSTDTNYILEFGGEYIRFWKGGNPSGQVTKLGAINSKAWDGISGHVQWVARNYAAGEFISVGKEHYLCHTAHAGSLANKPGENGSAWTSRWHAFAAAEPWSSTKTYSRYSIATTKINGYGRWIGSPPENVYLYHVCKVSSIVGSLNAAYWDTVDYRTPAATGGGGGGAVM